MATNSITPSKMRPAEVVKLVNSTDFGTVVSPAQVYRHFTEAGYRIASSEDSRQISFYRYVAWLVDRKNTPSEASLDHESARAEAARRSSERSLEGRDIGELPAVENQ